MHTVLGAVFIFVIVYGVISQKLIKIICECAGIGRQARLRGVCLRRMGSSPICRTRKKTILLNRLFSTKSVLQRNKSAKEDEITS